MIVSPEQVAKELTAITECMRADVAKMLAPGERVTVRVQFFDCVPFDLEIAANDQ